MSTEYFGGGSEAVRSARKWIAVFSWIAILSGIGIIAIGGIEFEVFLVGCGVVGAGISGLILKGILKGFETVVKASETYLKSRE